ncbi:MAG TPA: C45 family autoproteolytic acyltransferase/hydrolase [Kofleriaceae bacterium]|nr:C45 family autoproteolytic acyltransferase/hydrolase [Kofleriaceae bacterium]
MADLVIGKRRHSPQRALRATGLLAGLVIAAFVVAWFIYRRSVSYDVPGGDPPRHELVFDQPSPGAPARLRWGDASLLTLGEISVVRAAGEPFAIGAAHGRLLAAQIPANVHAFTPTLTGLAGSGGLFGDWTRGMRVDWRLRFVDDGTPDPHRRALAGIVRGARQSGVGVDYAALLRTTSALDIGVPARWTAEVESRRLTRALTFVAPQAGAAAGRLWVGRSFAMPGIGDGGDAAATPVVSLVRPAGRLAWAGVGWAGMAGAVTGINAEGIVVTVHPVSTRDVRATRTARPITLLARDVLETAHTLDEAVKLIEGTPTLGAAAFVIVDGQRGHWAVVERSPTRAGVRRDPAEPAVGDVLTSQAFSDDPENDRAGRISPSLRRLQRVLRLLREPPADAVAAAMVLRDRRSPEDEGLPYGHRAAVDDAAAVHVVLFDPASLAMWVADGPGAGSRMRAFDLRHELRGEGDRPIPPADIPADATQDPQTVIATRRARAELRAAREQAPSNRGRARERVARALALAPSLPEALVASGNLAQAAGDRATMRAAWERWLELGADDPGAEAAIRAALSAP